MIEPGYYRHFKGGRYEVIGVAAPSTEEATFADLIGIAKHSESPLTWIVVSRQPDGALVYSSKDIGVPAETLVVYRNRKDKSLWARPAAMFAESVEHEGKTVPRFVRE